MNRTLVAIVVAVAGTLLAAAGCNTAAPGADDRDFAAGAFPPTLSDTEYHQRAWSRPTCLSCHEHELDGAPKVEHNSLTKEAVQVKCRTCHVLELGSAPR